MGAETTRGDLPDNDRSTDAPSGWVTTQQAARALGISARTVRWHIDRGNLVAKPEGEGVKRTWLVSIDSLQAFRDSRQPAGTYPRDTRVDTEGPERLGSPIRELVDRLAEEATRAAEYRVRLELTEQAQSTLEAELGEERRRREDAERERDELRSELQQIRDAPETAIEEDTRGATPGDTGRLRASWWRRFFGF